MKLIYLLFKIIEIIGIITFLPLTLFIGIYGLCVAYRNSNDFESFKRNISLITFDGIKVFGGLGQEGV